MAPSTTSKKQTKNGPPKPTTTNPSTHQQPTLNHPLTTKHKQPRLPPNTKISKRPIHRPPIPHPSTSSSSPKTLYITSTSPFIPALKRIRKILASIAHRAAQSQSAQGELTFSTEGGASKVLRANGRLEAGDVERVIAEEGRRGMGGGDRGVGEGGGGGSGGAKGKGNARTEQVAGEKVYVKATGKAIERALEIGIYFQGEADCRVTVEMGSVRVIDDIEIVEGAEANGEEAEGMDIDKVVGDEEDKSKGTTDKVKKRAKTIVTEGEIPETRIRTLSSITVSISLR